MSNQKKVLSSGLIITAAVFLSIALLSMAWATLLHGTASAEAIVTGSVSVPSPVPTAPPPMGTVTATQTNTPGVPSPVPTAPAPPCAISFSDVQPTDWFYVPVQWIVCNHIASGYADGTFRPGANATRGQIAKMVVLASQWPLVNPAQPRFSDVPTDHPFYTYIETAALHGAISGYADGTFLPGNNVTRGQLSKIVVGARGWTLGTPTTPTFTDVPADSPFFQYVETAVAHNVISGYADHTFHPGSNATRSQLSKIMFAAYTNPLRRLSK